MENNVNQSSTTKAKVDNRKGGNVLDFLPIKSIENGVGVVRVFDALNDPRNLEVSMKAIKKYGGVCEATICYTSAVVDGQEVFTDEYFVKLDKEMEEYDTGNAISVYTGKFAPFTFCHLDKPYT